MAAARHAHHVGDDYEGEGESRQRAAVHPFPESQVIAYVRDAGKPTGQDRKEEDKNVSDEELGEGDRTQRHDVDGAVEPAIAIERREHAQRHGQGHRDDRGE